MNCIHFCFLLHVCQLVFTASHLPHHFLDVVGDFDFKLAEPLKKVFMKSLSQYHNFINNRETERQPYQNSIHSEGQWNLDCVKTNERI
jgi:hypothetical protein